MGIKAPPLLVSELHPSACVRRDGHRRSYCRVRRHERLQNSACSSRLDWRWVESSKCLDLPAELTGLPGERLAFPAVPRGFLAAFPVFLFVPEVYSAIPVFPSYYRAQDGRAAPQPYSPSWYSDVQC